MKGSEAQIRILPVRVAARPGVAIRSRLAVVDRVDALVRLGSLRAMRRRGAVESPIQDEAASFDSSSETQPDPGAAAATSRPRRVAFVLSRGGSLGAIQVGMLQALFEEGIEPDLLVGTSTGAVNAAWVAGHPHRDGVSELAGIWRGLRRQDIFPLSPWAGARGLLGRTNHFISNAGLRALIERHLRVFF